MFEDILLALLAWLIGAVSLVLGMLVIDFFLMDSSVLRDILRSAWRW